MAGNPAIVMAVPTPEASLPFEVAPWACDDDFVPERRRPAVHVNDLRLGGWNCRDQWRKGQHSGGKQNLNAFHVSSPFQIVPTLGS